MFKNTDIEKYISEEFIRASGPGGQNVNKVASAVKLFFDLENSGLPAEVKARLKVLAPGRINALGKLVIDSRTRRTREENREEARKRLERLINLAFIKPKKRRTTKPTLASKAARVDNKKRRGAIKTLRRKDIQKDE